MPTLNKFNSFTHELGNGTHLLGTHTLKAMLTNTAPAATNAVYADVSATELAAGGGYALGGFVLDSVTWTTAGGVAKLTIADEVFTATGATGQFRYVILYNDTPTAPAKPLIGWYDYGASITLNNSGETFTIDFDGTNGVLTVT